MAKTTMILNARQQQILKIINENGNALVKELSETCKASEATVRRDLDEMAKEGMIERIHGGAMKLTSTTFEKMHSEKMLSMLDEKKRITEYAAKYVHDGDSIFLDSGTTTFFLAQNLHKHKNLTIVTNNLDIVSSVEFDDSTIVIVTGGVRRSNYSVLIGDLAENSVKQFCVDIAFMGCDSININEGIYNTNYLELGIKQQISKCGKKLIILTDHSKFYTSALAKVCDISDIDLIITDKGIDQEIVKQMQKKTTEMICV